MNLVTTLHEYFIDINYLYIHLEHTVHMCAGCIIC